MISDPAACTFQNDSDDRLADFGAQPVWLSDNRHLVFRYEDKLMLCDTGTKEFETFYAVAPHALADGLAIDHKKQEIYFSQETTEVDIWLIDLHEPSEPLDR